MTKPEATVMLTDAQRESYERSQLKKISLKWAKIASERAKQDVFPGMESWRSNLPRDETG